MLKTGIFFNPLLNAVKYFKHFNLPTIFKWYFFTHHLNIIK